MTTYISETVDSLTAILPDCPPELIDLYALLAHTTGEDTTLKDVHEAWGFWKNRIKPDHKYLIEFELLTPEVQALDLKYMDAIHTVARQAAVSDR